MNSGNPSFIEGWCVTDVKANNYRFKWIINDFLKCALNKGMNYRDLYSSRFSADDINEFRLRVISYENNDKYIVLQLELTSVNEVHATYQFSVIDAQGNEGITKKLGRPIKLSNSMQIGSCNLDLLQNNNLTILFEISVLTDIINTSGHDKVKLKVPACRLSEHLGDLLNSEKFSDITLVVRDKEYKAHKAILAARSPVFAAMFEHDMEEKKNNRVNITDVDHETFSEMLRFIYTGCVSNMDKMAGTLLSASNKYAIERLKVMCEEALSQGISVENAADSLILADLYFADHLKAAIFNFINNKHTKDVMETTGWQLLTSSYQHLIVEVFNSLIMQQTDARPNDIVSKNEKA